MSRAAVASVPRPPKKNRSEASSNQVAIRLPLDVIKRIDEAGERLGLDRSNLIRLIIIEKLPEYECRARKAHEPSSTCPVTGD